jgi:hypothetical protein
MASWTARLGNRNANENTRTAEQFVNWATKVFETMNNRDFEASRRAIHAIDTIKAEIILGNYDQDTAIAVFNKRIGR